MFEMFGYCRKCGTARPDRQLSNRGICPDCGRMLLLDAISQLQAKRGPTYEKWRRNYIASMEATILKLRKEQDENDLRF